MFEIEFYDKDDETSPVKDFINGLPSKMQAKILRLIDLLEVNGNELREPYSKPLSGGLFELRCKQGTDITRIIYFFYIDKKIVLTNGFVKKKDKTPKSELNKAVKYKKDYIRRHKNE